MQHIKKPNFEIEKKYHNFRVCGIDEVGRGPVAGPVVACCAVLDQQHYPSDINDSKKLSKKQRQKILQELIDLEKQGYVKYAIGVVDHKIIDEINILQATKQAMLLSYQNLAEKYQDYPQVILVDGNMVPFAKHGNITEIMPIIQGDQHSLSIAAASIIAKEWRDNFMMQMDEKFPHYGFAQNAGYPTKLHRDAIDKYGICEIHRKSFAPINAKLPC